MSAVNRELIDFYAKTADGYDDDHALDIEHDTALAIATGFMLAHGVRTVLDLGCGTGRASLRLIERVPGVSCVGIDPSVDLLRIAKRRDMATLNVLQASGQRLPFADGQFDASICTAVLHHVAEPTAVIEEMIRVSRRLLFVSDTNTYAQGPFPERVVKVAARRFGVTRQLQTIKNGGKRSYSSDGDGVAYPYSVFDSIGDVEPHCSDVFVIPTRGGPLRHQSPLQHARNALLVGVLRTTP